LIFGCKRENNIPAQEQILKADYFENTIIEVDTTDKLIQEDNSSTIFPFVRYVSRGTVFLVF